MKKKLLLILWICQFKINIVKYILTTMFQTCVESCITIVAILSSTQTYVKMVFLDFFLNAVTWKSLSVNCNGSFIAILVKCFNSKIYSSVHVKC